MKKTTVNSKTERTHTPEKVKVMSSWRENIRRPVVVSLEEIYREENNTTYPYMRGIK